MRLPIDTRPSGAIARDRTALHAGLLLLVLGAACAKPRPAWLDEEPDVFDLKLKEGVTQATPDQVQQVKVAKGRLTFPKSTVADVAKAFPIGKPIIGGESTENPTDNPFGFLRKVKAVTTSGDSVVVETEPAAIEEIVDGTISQTFDPMTAPVVQLPPGFDTTPYFPEIPVGDGVAPPPGGGQPLWGEPGDLGTFESPIHDTVDLSEVFSLQGSLNVVGFQRTKTVGSGNKAVTFNLSANAKLTTEFRFQPQIHFHFETTRARLDDFEMWVRGTYHSVNTLDLTAGVTVANGTEPTKLVGAAELLAEGPEVGKGLRFFIAQSPPIKGPRIYGVPTTFKVLMYADCGYGVQGSMNANAKVTLDADMKAGLEYHRDSGWEGIHEFSLQKSATASLLSGGGVAVECGVSPRIEWLIGDLGGPYLGLRAGVRASAAMVEQCNDKSPENGKPDVATRMQVKPFLQVQTGGELDVFHVVSFEVGPYTLYEWPAADAAPLWSTEKTFPKAGFGYCVVPCGNGTKDGDEKDVDCGGPICRKCKAGSPCSAPSDCLSGGCDAFTSTCAASPCSDNVRTLDETDVDCGGASCDPCGLGRQCAANRDCAVGFCSRTLSNGLRVCTTNLCEDGLVSGTEGDVDCGASIGCTLACTTGQSCHVNEDCASAACHATLHACIDDHCLDERADADETDVDCGGSCEKKCEGGQRCNPRAPDGGGAGCVKGNCNAATARCVDNPCQDGRQNNEETDVDCGGSTCGKCPIGASCEDGDDCEGGAVCHLRTHRCAAPGCGDGYKNGEESAVDCGGSTCGKCPISKSCNANSDCVTNSCVGGRCRGGPCENEVKDANETDVDCGGACGGLRCGLGQGCLVAGDCASNICVNDRCISDPCLDRVRNGEETDVDCGGSKCAARCTTGRTCTAGTDCAGGICSAATHQCVADQCHDGERNGAETDVDCGGTCATKCAVNKACAASADCASGTCNLVTGRCVPDRCFDGLLNGSETDLDCGGSCAPKCRRDKSCAVDRDCQSGACTAATKQCAADQCSDARLDGDETDVDCGGSCDSPCPLGRACLTGADCVHPQGLVGVPGYCAVASHACVAESCGDGVKDGDETGVDCGGSCAQKCAVGEGCNGADNCTSGICNVTTRKCVATHCENGVKDLDEVDIDCGSPETAPARGCYQGCALAKACRYPWDCESGYCGQSGTCRARVPNSCADAVRFGDRTTGLKEIDPDGPARWDALARPPPRGTNVSAEYVPPAGWSDSVLTWCDNDRDGGQWTPTAYLNSYDLGSLVGSGGAGLLSNDTWMGRGGCQSDADCDSNNYTIGNRCVAYKGGAVKFCLGSNPARSDVHGLHGAPQNYSVASAGSANYYHSSRIGIAHPSKVGWYTPNGGLGGMNGTPYVSEYRWDAWRNGSLVYTSGPRPYQNRIAPDANGIMEVGQYRGERQWCQGDGPYFTSLASLEASPLPLGIGGDDATGYSNPLRYRCRGFGFWGANGYGLGGVLMRYFPGGVVTLSTETDGFGSPVGPRFGLWVGSYGNQSGSASAIYGQSVLYATRMGVCNTFERTTSCLPVRHPVNEYPVLWGSSEFSDANGGTELAERTPGLVFVLWTR